MENTVCKLLFMLKKHIYEDAHEDQKQPLSVRTFGSAPKYPYADFNGRDFNMIRKQSQEKPGATTHWSFLIQLLLNKLH
jgi:hypothetical protein